MINKKVRVFRLQLYSIDRAFDVCACSRFLPVLASCVFASLLEVYAFTSAARSPGLRRPARATEPSKNPMRLRTTALALLCAAACLAAGPACARAEDPADAAPPGEVPDFAKLRIGALRQILDDRGLECRGCAEKGDFVQMARDNYHLPVVEKPAETARDPDPSLSGSDSKPGDVDIDEMMRQMGMNNEDTGDPETDAILRKLRAKGINIAGKNGMGGMDIEQLRKLEQAMGGIGGGGVDAGGRDGAKRRRAKKRRDEAVDAEEEL